MWTKMGAYFTFIIFYSEKDIAHLPYVPLTLPEENREEKVKTEEQKIRREKEAVLA